MNFELSKIQTSNKRLVYLQDQVNIATNISTRYIMKIRILQHFCFEKIEFIYEDITLPY